MQSVAPDGEFASRILGNQPQMDLKQAQDDVVAAALDLKTRVPEITTIVLECTNMPPYLAAIEAATGCKVLSLMDDVRLFKPFAQPLPNQDTAQS